MKNFLLSFLLASSVFAFEPNIPEEENETAAPAIIAPLIEPVVSRDPFAESFTRSTGVIVEQIATSRFYLEFKPFKFNYKNSSSQSDLSVDYYKFYEEHQEVFNVKMLPLDFRFGFENASWGSFADIEIEDGTQRSEFTVYSNGVYSKIGLGLILNFKNTTYRAKNFGVYVQDVNEESLEIAPFLFLAFKFVDNEYLEVNQWNKLGSIFTRKVIGGVEFSGLGIRYNMGLDFMFKVNKNVQIGLGGEFELKAQRVEFRNVPDNSGSALMLDFEIDLFKIKYLF